MKYSVSDNHLAQQEERRLAALLAYDILDTPEEAEFDEIAQIAALICEAPIAVINFIDRDRQWFKSVLGLNVRETPLDISICAHVILQPDLFVVPDTRLDARFANNPLVIGEPNLRFYAGALLKSEEGYPIGTLCVLDYQPRGLSENQRFALTALANQVMTHLELLQAYKKQTVLIQELQSTQEKLLQLAATDSLSGLLNRRAFEQSLSRELVLINRNATQAALVMIDIDHFKVINDKFGHDIGDEVIQRFARLCRNMFRQSDVVSRWGGEEFVVLLPNTSEAEALKIVERVHQALKITSLVSAGQQPVFITVSAGICRLTQNSEQKTSLRTADKLLYMAKDNGRNCTVCESSQTVVLKVIQG